MHQALALEHLTAVTDSTDKRKRKSVTASINVRVLRGVRLPQLRLAMGGRALGDHALQVWRLAGLLRAAACWLVLCVPLLLCSALSVLSLGHAAPVEAQARSALPVPGLTRAPKNDAAPQGLAVRPAQRRQQPPHTTADGEALQQRLQLCVTGALPVRVVVVTASALDTVALAMVRIRVSLFKRRVADMSGLHLRLTTRGGRMMPPYETLSSLGLSP